MKTMRTMKRLLMCLLMAGIFTAATGCDELGLTDYLYDDWGYDTYWYDDGGWDTGSSSGTFFSDYGGSVSWW